MLGRSASFLSFLGAFAVCCVLLPSTGVEGVAVMSVDLGTEWMKIAVVTPGVPMEIALNPESKRKTSVAVALRDGERLFGGDAMASGVRFPKNCYFYLLDLLGKKVEHPQVQQFMKTFPYYDIQPHPETGTVLFQHDEETLYSVEELMAMVLEHAKSIAEAYTEQKVKDAVLTVPAYFNQAERRSLLLSAELAGINVLQLISEPLAVGLNYGMFRRKEVNATVRNIMFYDMGAQDTTVSIIAFQEIKTKERGFSEKHPQAQVMGIGYDRELGGAQIQIRLRDFLAEEFNKLGKTKTDVRTVPRAMGKLMKEAGRVKTVLSANNQVYAQIENVMEDIDFRMEVKREKLLELNEGYFARVIAPVKMALDAGGMTREEIHDVILVGAGTRVPKVQEVLVDFLKTELGKNLNTDESAAMGAVYKAADLSSGFKVKKFITKEGVLFPIDVDFEREYENEEGQAAVKQVRRSLFSRMNPYPQKKIMTFNKHVDDFTFNVNFNELDHLNAKELDLLGPLQLATVRVSGVAKALEENLGENVESKGVKAHFALDDSGLLSVSSVESVFEKTITVEQQEAEEKAKNKAGDGDDYEDSSKNSDATGEEGEKKGKDGGGAPGEDDTAWDKLGDTISSFFNKDGEEQNTDGENKDDKKSEESSKKKEDSPKKKGKKEEEAKTKKPKIETIKVPLDFDVTITDQTEFSKETIASSKKKLKLLNDHDAEKKLRETSLNNLESFVIDVRDKLYQELYEQSSTEEEREKISATCSQISDWIDEEVMPDTDIKLLDEKLGELKSLTSSWFARVREHTDRPEALAALNHMLNTSEHFIKKAKNATGDEGFFTLTELETLEKKIAEVKTWRDEEEEKQAAQPMHEMPKMTTSVIAEKGLEVDREVKYLINKAKIAQAEKEKEKRKKEAEEKKAKEAEEKEKKKKEKKKKKKKGKDDSSSSNSAEDGTPNVEENEEVTEKNDYGGIPLSEDEEPKGDQPEEGRQHTSSEKEEEDADKNEKTGEKIEL